MTGAEDAKFLPLTTLQRRMVLASVRAPRSGVYVLQDICESAEELNSQLLRSAWTNVVRRYPALRTVIDIVEEGQIRKRILDNPQMRWREVDCADMAEVLRADREQGFDFGEGVPIRWTVVRPSTLVWSCHHVLLDGRSLLLVWKEVLEEYYALLEHRDVRLPPAPGVRITAAAEEGHWQEYLAGIPESTGYIVDHLPHADHAGIATHASSLPADVTRNLWEFARAQSLTMNTLVLAAWALLLSRYSGRTDIVFGATRAGRGSGDNRVGFFIDTVPVRIAVEQQMAVVDWLHDVRRNWLSLRGWIAPGEGSPPFDSVVVYEHESPAETLRNIGWTDYHFTRVQATDAPLTLGIYGWPNLSIHISCDTRQYSAPTIAGLAQHLETILLSFLAQPAAAVAEVRMLGRGEEHWLAHEVNDTAQEYPRELCVHRLFERHSARQPAKAALDVAGAAISYADLNRRANQLAWYLRDQGVGPEDLVALSFAPSADLVTAILAVMKAGAAFFPVDPDIPTDRMSRILNDARPKLVWIALPSVADRPTDNLPDIAGPENAAYAIYTSGSSGQPKAVVIPNRALLNHTLGARNALGISETDRRLQFASPASDVYVAEVFNYLSCGATLVFGSSPGERSMATFMRALDEHRITITGIPSTWWSEWVQAGCTVPPSLRAVVVGMERVNPASVAVWRRTVGGRVRLFNSYGPSETCPSSAIHEIGISEWESGSVVPIGKPIANVQIHVLDGDGRLVPAGVAGEMCIGGDGVGRGYLNRAELTGEKFVPDPFRAGGRLYKTGDLGFRLPDGKLVFLGRADRQVKIRGFRIEPEEIEFVLAQHAGVRQCAVLPDEAESRLVAYIVPADEGRVRVDELRRHLARDLPAYMIPARFLRVGGIPRTASGKLDRLALRNMAIEEVVGSTPLQRPVTDMENRIAAIWRDVLGLSEAGVTDNFFDSGGDSVRATRLITRIRAELGKEVPLASLLRGGTIAHLAAGLENGAGPAKEMTSLPLVFISSCAEDAAMFRHIADHIGEDQPVFVLATPAADKVQSVEQLAKRVCGTLGESGWKGPWLLGGYCFGGILAFEAAHQLKADGEEVRLVLLFDTPAPGYPKLLRRTRRYWDQFVEQAASAEAGRHLAAVRRYKPKSTAVPLVQFVASEAPVSRFGDARLGWGDLTTGGLRVISVPGSHTTFFQEPHARRTAAMLTEVLESVAPVQFCKTASIP